MTQLFIDIGNTRIKWAYGGLDPSQGALRAPGEIVHADLATKAAKAFVAELSETPESIYAVNVAGPEIEQALAEALAERFDLSMQLVRTSARFGAVVNGYTATEQLGADRWAAVVGGWYACQQSVVVVDAGTAVTIDLVQADGVHLGGIIVPGLDLMQASLNRDTSDISDFVANSKGPVPGDDWFGRDTSSAVKRGALFSICAVIQQAIAAFPGDEAPRVLLTGGDAEVLLTAIHISVEHRPRLVLEGLRRLAGGFA